MIIKKFVGKTEEAATEAAKKELGEGIVIMNVKNIKQKGLFALLRSRQVEVTAAIEEPEQYTPPRKEPARATGGEQKLSSLTGSISEESSQNIEKKLESLQTLLVNQIQRSEAEKSEKSEAKKEEAVQEKVQEKKEEQLEEAKEEQDSEQVKFIKLLYNTMLDNEVDEKYINQILDEVDKNKKPNLPMDYLLVNVYQKMILKFGRAEGISPAEKGPKVVLFVGPTGVGKTTTIAKIASSYAMNEKKRVALFTADTYRIAAAEQLRTYANILEVPFRVIYAPEELQKGIEDFHDYDYIFVDTAGHSHQNEEQLQKMKEFLDGVKEVAEYQVFLVLSVTTKYRDLVRIADCYQKITEYQLIFTKLDESSVQGNMLNLKLYTDAPIAFVTDGQNVPDDIEQFNPQKAVKLLLGGKN